MTVDYRNRYGAIETNGFEPGEQDAIFDRMNQGGNQTVYWDTKGLRVTRLRLLTDPGFPVWDVSYCYGELADGTAVRVSLPFHQLPKYRVSGAIIDHAKRDGVYAKGLGILDAISTVC